MLSFFKEESFFKLLQHLEGKLDFEELTGIAFRDNNDEIVLLPPSKRMKDIGQNVIPFPARHLLPMENYIKAQEAHGPSSGRWTSILSSRGCPYSCTFCESRKTKWIARSPEDVVDEIEH